MPHILIDILPLKEGKTAADAKAYFDSIANVLARNGITPATAPIEPMKVLRGDIAAQYVNIFATDNPEKSMQGMQSDPDYQAKITERDALFDLGAATLILGKQLS